MGVMSARGKTTSRWVWVSVRDLMPGVDAGHPVTKAVLFEGADRPVARGSGSLR